MSRRAVGSWRRKASHQRADDHKPREHSQAELCLREPALLGRPPLPQLGCSCHIPVLPSPGPAWETPLRRPLGCSAHALVKPPSLSPTLSPHTVGTGLAVACADFWGTRSPGSLVSGLDHCLLVWGALLPFQRSDPLSWGEILVSMACTVSPPHSQRGHEH